MERVASFQQLGITRFDDGDVLNRRTHENSNTHFELWNEAVVDEALDPITGASTTIFNLDKLGMTGNTAYELVAFHRPKTGSVLNADGLFVHKMPHNNGIFVWVGDGLSFVFEPPDEIKDILTKYGCSNRPDALPRTILQNPEWNIAWTGSGWKEPHFSWQKVTGEFMRAYEHQMNKFYRANRVEVNNIPASQLPSTCGTAVYLQNYGQIAISGIGDLPNKIKVGGVFQELHARQNLGIDRLTVEKINALLEKGVAPTVTEVRKSKKFIDWIRFTFEEKLNKSVTVISGNGGYHQGHAVNCFYPPEWVSAVCIATDGITLGQEDPDQVYVDLERCQSAHDFNSFVNKVGNSQGQNYREDRCTQEKEKDDIGGVLIRFRNDFDRTVLGAMMK